MLKNKENIILIVLLLVIIILYFKKYYKKEDFEVIFSPYYPITNQVVTKTNNYETKVFHLSNIIFRVLTKSLDCN